MTNSPMQRRHIVFVGGTSEPGGLHIHTAEVVQACSALGHRVTILCPSVNYFEGLLYDTRVAVKCIRPLEEGTRYERVARWIRLAPWYRGADVVFCRGRFAENGISDLATVASFARRVYAIEHRPWEGPWNRRLSKPQYGRLSGMLLKLSIGVSDEIATSAVGNFQFPSKKTRTCLNWVHPDFHLPTEAERLQARIDLGIEPSILHVGYVGRLAPEKRVDVLLRAFALLLSRIKHPVSLGIMGDGWKRQELAKLSAELGIGNHVRFHGWSESPAKMLQASDIFVLPSLVEGFPLSLLEAMASGCACLAHPMSSTLHLIQSKEHGLLTKLDDAEGLAEGLAVLSTLGREGRRRIGDAAAAKVERDFSRRRRLPDLLAALDVSATPLPDAGPRLLSFNVG